MKISQALPADHALLMSLIREYYAYDHIAFDGDRIAPALQILLASPARGTVSLFKRDAIVLGYSIVTYGFDLEFGGPLATLTDLYFKPEFRGQGLGRKALDAISENAKHMGMGAVELQVERDNVEAQGLYRKVGYTELDRLTLVKRL